MQRFGKCRWSAISSIKQLPPAQQETCEYWDAESDYCTLCRPSAQPTADVVERSRWIPVTERLPERKSFALVTDLLEVEEAYYDSDGNWWQVWGDRLKNVTAWMPLPEPYREEAEDEDD